MQNSTSTTGGRFIFLVLVAFVVVLCAVVGHKFRTSASYRMGLELAKNDPTVLELFGSPITEIPFITGETIGNRDRSESIRLYTLLYGPKAHGKLFIFGEEKNGICQRLYLEILIGGKITLIYDSRAPDKGFQPYVPVP